MTDVQAQLAVVFAAIIGLAVIVVRLVGPIIDARAENFAKKEWATIEAKLPKNVVAAINAAAIFGAQAAEQLGLAQKIANNIDAKKQYAVQAAERWLKAQGYTIDLETIADAIETVILQGLHLPPPVITPQTAQAGNIAALAQSIAKNTASVNEPSSGSVTIALSETASVPPPDKTQQVPTPAVD